MNSKAGYIFGGDTGVSYDDLQRRRKIAEQLMQQNSHTPRSVGEGLHAIGRALVVRGLNKKNTEAAEALKDQYGGMWGSITDALGGGNTPFSSAPYSPPDPNSAESLGQDTMAALGKGPDYAGLEKSYNLPTGYLARTAQIESGGNPNAKNPNSSATGPFQFIDSTARQYGLTDRTDPIASADAAGRLARDNANTLRQALGREPTAGELYLAHQQGGGGAAKLLANPNARAADVVGMKAVTLNGGSANMTAGEFANKWVGKFGGGNSGGVRTAQAGGIDPSILQMAQLLSAPDEFMPPGQKAVVQALMARKMQQSDPVQQLQLERLQLDIDKARNPDAKPREREKDANGRWRYVDDSSLVFSDIETGATADVEGESKLRKEFTGLQPTKDFQKQAEAYGRIVASSKDPSPAGDLALIFNYMKVLDPGSVVRESEFATAENSAAVPDRIRNIYNKVLSGERLTPEQRRDFVGRAAELYNQAEQQHDDVANQYGITAESYGFERDRTIPDFRFRPQGAPPTSLRPQLRPGTESLTPPASPGGAEVTFEIFSQDPSAQAAAEQYGVTLEEMWAIKQGSR